MQGRLFGVFLAALGLAGCARESWPDPPAVDQAAYEAQYKAWREERRETAEYAVRILGIWPLLEDDTPFGSDGSLPIVLPTRVVPSRAGVFRRTGTKVEVVPARGVSLRLPDGAAVEGSAEVGVVSLGSVRMTAWAMGEGAGARVFVDASDDKHPALENLAEVATYPVDPRWRVAARFDKFDVPKPLRVPDVRGGFMDFMALGELAFPLDGQPQRLIAIGEAGDDEFFVMFKDPTNASTTYRGYRILSPAAVADGKWTVLDFNLASNPPCAYSPFTVCPLPPPENRLHVAVEAGEKRHPTAKGFGVE